MNEEKKMNINDYPGLNDNSNSLLDSILSYEDAEQILEHIDEQKYTLSKNKNSNQQSYIVLLIVEQM